MADKKSGTHKRRENDEETPDFYVVTDELDLHGFFPEQVPEIMDEFLANAVELGLKRLRIIHGKGRSKLKFLVHQRLKAHPKVKKFGDAPPQAGGWGATVVMLE